MIYSSSRESFPVPHGNLVVRLMMPAACLASILFVPAARAGSLLPNGDFSYPSLTGLGASTADAYDYYNYATPELFSLKTLISDSTISTASLDWSFTGNAGIAAVGSAFGVNGTVNANSPSLASPINQVGVLQDADHGTSANPSISASSIYQSVSLGVGPESLSFYAEGRGYQGPTGIDVYVFYGNTVSITPIFSITPAVGNFTQYTVPFVITKGGSYTIDFVGDNKSPGTDYSSFIDDVSVNRVVGVSNGAPIPVPLPAAAGVGFSMLGGCGLFVSLRRKFFRKPRIA